MKRVSALVLMLVCMDFAHAESATDLIRKGDALDAKNQNADALVIYLEADRQQPGDPEILRRISKQYAQQMADSGGDAPELGDKALDYALRAVKAGPDNAQAHLALAIVYGKISYLKPARQRMQDSRTILEEARKAVELDPANDLAWHVVGRWNYEVANLSGPVKFIAETLYGKLPDASNEKALECFEKAAALNPKRLLNQAELGRALAAVGRKDEARAALEKALGMPSREKDDDETKERARKALNALD
jgi:tetratricopeptide (TPR) repeat protein